jgi:hypothetical protein
MTTTRRVILLSGNPNNGKSHLTKALHEQHGFHKIETDDVYVQYVRAFQPNFYLPVLGQVILQHYDYIFSGVPALVEQWHTHLLGLIVQASNEHPNIVVEGYLLRDCKDWFALTLREQGRQVFLVRMENRVPVLEQSAGLTVTEVASLSAVTPADS